MEEGLAVTEVALELAEGFGLPEVFSHALNSRAMVLQRRDRPLEARLLLEHALDVALRNDLSSAALRAYNNLAVLFDSLDLFVEHLNNAEASLELARRVGNRPAEWAILTGYAGELVFMGHWDQAQDWADLAQENAGDEATEYSLMSLTDLVLIYAGRGDLPAARALLERFESIKRSEDPQRRVMYADNEATLLIAEGRYEEALEAALIAVAAGAQLGMSSFAVKAGLALAMESARALGKDAKLEELLSIIEHLRPGQITPYFRALGAQYGAHLASMRGDQETPKDGFARAEAIFRDNGTLYPLARLLIEHAEWALDQAPGEDVGALLAEAGDLLAQMRATVFIERVERARARVGTPVKA
jgi:hypothetical protein